MNEKPSKRDQSQYSATDFVDFLKKRVNRCKKKTTCTNVLTLILYVLLLFILQAGASLYQDSTGVKGTKIARVKKIKEKDEKALLAAVAKYGPIAVTIHVVESFENLNYYNGTHIFYFWLPLVVKSLKGLIHLFFFPIF